MSTTLKGVALGLAVPLVLAISGWAGWSALTANLPPAEISTIDESHRGDISNSLRREVTAAPAQIEQGPGPDQLRGTAERRQPSSSGPDGEMAVAPANVTDSAIKPATTGQAEPLPPKPPNPKIRFVRVPKAPAQSLTSTLPPAQASVEKVSREASRAEPARGRKKSRL
jgi:hypothetical protein